MKLIFIFLGLTTIQMCYSQSDSAIDKSLQYENRGWEAYQAHRFENAVSEGTERNSKMIVADDLPNLLFNI